MKKEGVVIEDIIYPIKKKWKMIVGTTVACTVVAALVSSFIIKPKYETSIKLFVGKQVTSSNPNNYDYSEVTMYQNLVKTYADIYKTQDYIKAGLKDINMPTDQVEVSKVLNNLQVLPSSNTQIIEVTYETTNKKELVPLVNSITNVFINRTKELVPNGNVQVIESPQNPNKPASPNILINTIIGFFIGLIFSVGLTLIIDYLDDRIKTADELEGMLDLPILGSIPHRED